MHTGMFAKLEAPSPSWTYPSVFPRPTDFDAAFTEFVRANHSQVAIVHPPTRQDTFDTIRANEQILAVASQGIRVYCFKVDSAEAAVELQRQRSEGLAIRLDYFRMPAALFDTQRVQLGSVRETEVVNNF